MAGRAKWFSRGQILPLWIAGYGILRFIVESIRTDPASLILGIRVNHWISGLAVVVGLLWFMKMRRSAAPPLKPISSFEDLAADSDDATDDDSADVDPEELDEDRDRDGDEPGDDPKPLFS